jgi:hypothetical protein
MEIMQNKDGKATARKAVATLAATARALEDSTATQRRVTVLEDTSSSSSSSSSSSQSDDTKKKEKNAEKSVPSTSSSSSPSRNALPESISWLVTYRWNRVSRRFLFAAFWSSTRFPRVVSLWRNLFGRWQFAGSMKESCTHRNEHVRRMCCWFDQTG